MEVPFASLFIEPTHKLQKLRREARVTRPAVERRPHVEEVGRQVGASAPYSASPFLKVAEAYEETTEKAALRSLLAEVVRRELEILRKGCG